MDLWIKSADCVGEHYSEPVPRNGRSDLELLQHALDQRDLVALWHPRSVTQLIDLNVVDVDCSGVLDESDLDDLIVAQQQQAA